MFSSKMEHSHFLLFFLILFLLCYCNNGTNDFYDLCSSANYKCGDIQGIKYPFWGNDVPEFCGHHAFHLNCFHDKFPFMQIGNQRFFLLNLNQQLFSMKIVRWDLWQTTCPVTENLQDVTLDNELFRYTLTCRNLTLMYKCPLVDSVKQCNFTCDQSSSGVHIYNYYADEVTWGTQKLDLKIHCKAHLTTTVSQPALIQLYSSSKTVNEVVSEGFEVEYEAHTHDCVNCQVSGGICGSNLTTGDFLCFRRDQPTKNESFSGPGTFSGQKPSLKMPVIGIIGYAIAGILLLIVILWSLWNHKRSIASNPTQIVCCQKVKANKNVEEMIRQLIAPIQFSYEDVRKMTDSFKHKLGQGGSGSVYKGRLQDGHPVAVKILNENLRGKRNGEGFMNEVVSISKTSHVNIVSLVGFCFEGHKKALVYEFMANGSLEKYIYDNKTCLGWDSLYEIAIGIARGLEYLHGGCKTQILHFDIKPHNILLDEYFRPKIADFGLSKLCCGKESLTSVEYARGTMGYIAPEVYSRNFGKVTYKADVYSYGMMILEIASGRKNTNVRVENASKIYFPHWIYTRLQREDDLGLCCVRTKEEHEIARKMIIVGLWCIQINPCHRPSMSQVLFMLQVCSDTLEIPQMNFNGSPQSSSSNYSAASV